MEARELQRFLKGGARLSLAILLLAGGLLTACSDYSADEIQGKVLPAGGYPVTLTASVRAATRSTADNDAWTGGEQVAVEATSYLAGVQPEVKIYTTAADGTLTTGIPFWWTRNNEWKLFQAWYCADGSTAQGGANATAVPAKWGVKADQRGEGYAQSDFLFAVTEASYADYSAKPVPMKFHHQTAKVVVNILKAEYATSAERISSVHIGNDLLLDAGFKAPDIGALTGDWGSGGTRGAIEPRQLSATTNPEQYVATYEALVIPQETAGKCMLAVGTDLGATLYYNAPADAQPLAAGKVRTYNITVKVDRLEVETVSGGTWVACGEENVTSKKVKQSFTADELKIGDYFYSDGTWSDGGLRKIYTDGSMKIASPKPAPVLQTKSEIERRVIGIVFQTDPSRIGTAEKSKLGEGNVHGLVMALKNTATDIQWSHEENNLEDVKDCWSKSEIYSDISGLHNYTKILDHANSIGGIEAYPAFEAVEKWNDMYSINEYRPPRNTTGWFIPSSGQWWDILQNLGGCPAMADKGQQTSSDSGDFRWLGQGDVPAALNAWMNKIAADSKNDFTTGDRFWSSSELNQFRARNWNVYSSDYVCCDFVYKKWSNAVRPVLAF